MKKLMTIMAGLAVLACNNKSDSDKMMYSELVASNLKGDISSIEETPYKTDSTGKVGEMDSCCSNTTEYDENGNSLKTVTKDSKGTISGESVFTRFPNGLFKSVANTKDGKSTGGFNTEMDDKGNYTLAQAIDSNGKTEIYYTDITMNEVMEVTGWKQYDKDSVFRESGEIQYNKHQFLGNTTKDSVGTVKSHGSASYNEKGEQTEFVNTVMNKDGSTKITITKYTYESHDENGNWTQRTTWNKEGKATGVTKRTYIYRKK